MPTFLQPVALPDRCFLQEVLLWVAFQRLPLAEYTHDGEDFRSSREIGGYAVDFVDSFFSHDETERAGLPIDPRWPVHPSEGVTLPVARYDELLSKYDLDPDTRKRLEAEREDAREYQKESEAWLLHYERAIEYPASQIFVALKSGRLKAMGRLLPDPDVKAALSILEADGRDLFDIVPTNIPGGFWSLQGIDFNVSAARSAADHYCHISCLTEDVLSVFPGDREEVAGVERIGDTFVLSERPRVVQPKRSQRGRPPYPWDAFHLEIAGLLRRGELPEKKEAAIEHFQGWFFREHGVKASRSVLGDKLKPYYDRFIKSAGQKFQ
jgi:hypothetical protein